MIQALLCALQICQFENVFLDVMFWFLDSQTVIILKQMLGKGYFLLLWILDQI